MRLSVCIPCYNAAPFLEKCLRSALSQIGPTDEIILIDDGSTDGSVVVAKRHLRTQDTLVTRENWGAGRTRNQLLDLARGEFLIFLDADDQLEPGILDLYFQHTNEADLIYGDTKFIDSAGKQIGSEIHTPETGDSVLNIFHRGPITSSAMIRKTAVHVRWNTKYDCCDEYYFWLHQALNGCRCLHLPLYAAAVRQHVSPTRRTLAAAGRKSHSWTLLAMSWEVRSHFIANEFAHSPREAFFRLKLTEWMTASIQQGTEQFLDDTKDVLGYLGSGVKMLQSCYVHRRSMPTVNFLHIVKLFVKHNLFRFYGVKRKK